MLAKPECLIFYPDELFHNFDLNLIMNYKYYKGCLTPEFDYHVASWVLKCLKSNILWLLHLFLQHFGGLWTAVCKAGFQGQFVFFSMHILYLRASLFLQSTHFCVRVNCVWFPLCKLTQVFVHWSCYREHDFLFADHLRFNLRPGDVVWI